MGDSNDNLLSISQKLLKKISNRNLSDINSDSESTHTMESPEIASKYFFTSRARMLPIQTLTTFAIHSLSIKGTM